ncbi:MAG: HEAT repeat domain-containing protein, partial [Anaerolineales bacterium]|nr:HEAT repeat domain-containing protein [Anaerolineales bacterium]
PSSPGIEMACRLMVHPDHAYQEASARFLYDAKDPVAVPYLIEALQSDDYGVIRESALALGNIGDPRAEPHLLELVARYDNDETYSDDRLDDAYPIIRASAFTALCLLNSASARKKILESVFYDRDKAIQQRAIRYLIMEYPEEAMSYLEELMVVQPDTIFELISTAPEASIPHLKELVKHEDIEIALLAKKYLEEADQKRAENVKLLIESMHNIVSMPEKAIPYLERLLEHPEMEVATLAREYLNELR